MAFKTSSRQKIALLLGLVIILLGFAFCATVFIESRSVNFRSTQDPFPAKRLQENCCRVANMEGLADLNAYGSGVVYYKKFKEYFKEMPKKIYVINLLNDDIYYYKDHCLRWYGLGYMDSNLGEILFTASPMKVGYKAMVRFIFGSPPVHDLAQLKTERQIIEDLGGHYFVPLKDHRGWLNNQNFIDGLLRFFESIPEDSLVYIHCTHGKGRTTTFLVLYDIFRNGKKVPLKEITNRHYCLGRENVVDTQLWANGTWTQKSLNARKHLVERFYDYMTDQQGYGHQSWAQWRTAEGIQTIPVAIHRDGDAAEG